MRVTIVTILAAAGLLAGCGGGEGNESAGKADESAGSPQMAAAEAEAEEIDCDDVKGQTAPQGQPADDILGLRHGMTVAQARAVLQCTNKAYQITVDHAPSIPSNFPAPNAAILNADSGLDDVRADFLGPRGSERLFRVARRLEYADGNEPIFAIVVGALEKKYGPFDQGSYYSGGQNQDGVRIFAPSGERLGKSNSDFSQCMYAVGTNFSSSYTIRNCGPVVYYRAEGKSGNQQLVQNFTVVSMNGSAALRDGDSMRAAAIERGTDPDQSGDAPAL